ncbi:hypothetical protein TG4357_03744 [Thalassovita gelatinovora]|uniref:Uncharacterized protein n=1 Tax=Thalassovita gelatinovora TaxID=53501 RepID=A0A0N7LWC3_THAGE|nr:hypothetical protein [Thalassovita gelatinovora]QIZ79078.1 hypothetical protein HFZ77_00595 [Thalassovita gelatinovora]CUH68698.1 hypothetical protein TG4357_03744 [Thalassovita gelatinovora]SEQ56894.1 hypothetical protein SAMN04488043_106205 [Thalassovita gelatinovora]
MLNMYPELTITDAMLTASNVPEDDYPVYDPAAIYAASDQVIVIATHSVYQSVSGGNSGNDPTTDDGTNWIRIGPTNRWKAFDNTVLGGTENAGTITYSIEPDVLVLAIYFVELSASKVRVQVFDPGDNEVWDRTVELVDYSTMIDYAHVYWWNGGYQTKELLTGIPGYVGNRIEITIGDGFGTAGVGQIVLASQVNIGIPISGARVSLTDFSKKEQNEFGAFTITKRGYAREVQYPVLVAAPEGERVLRELERYLACPVVFAVSEGHTKYGTTIYGYVIDPYITLETGSDSEMVIVVKGIV